MKNITINLFYPVLLAIYIWCGVAGKVSWWVILLMLLSSVKLTTKINL
jgi:hypothetical protein